MNKIEKSRIEHFLHEYHTWERTLDFFRTENAYLKTRLSAFLDNDSHNNFLQTAENYQNQFLQIDELAKNLKHQVVEMEMWAEQRKNKKDKIAFAEIESKQKKVRLAIERLEVDFLKLKNEFNTYLEEAL
ncbi:MAG: hypothetical protein KA319_12170 [Ferruginibacter sp.]|nr:hypothetical protein [Ferruginibacter sp.]